MLAWTLIKFDMRHEMIKCVAGKIWKIFHHLCWDFPFTPEQLLGAGGGGGGGMFQLCPTTSPSLSLLLPSGLFLSLTVFPQPRQRPSAREMS